MRRPVSNLLTVSTLARQEGRKANGDLSTANTFEAVAREFLDTKAHDWTPGYAEKWLRGLTKSVFPYLGSLPIATITAAMLLNTLRRVEQRGTIDTAHTLRQTTGRVSVRHSDWAMRSQPCN